MKDYFATTGAAVSWPHPLLLNEDSIEDTPTFEICPPTFEEMEHLGQELYRRGLYPVQRDTLHATIIDEAFNLYGEERGEELASIFDAVWREEERYSEAFALWREQERERLIDVARTGIMSEQIPMPTKLTSYRQRSTAQLAMDDINARSQKLRDLTVRGARYNIDQRIMVARLQLRGWKNLAAPFVRDDGMVTEDSMQALFDEIGRDAFDALIYHVESLANVSREEVGNSDLPLESGSPPSGSAEQNGEQESSSGSSTASAIAPALADASGPTIGASSIIS